MTQTCTRCSRPNPSEAAFCYHDGAPLPGRAGAAAKLQFPAPFVFPSGRECHTFDQLASACCESWNDARAMLREGYLQSFFAGVGRGDLAVAAREAAAFPDLDRGLDQLLDKLPGNSLKPAQLHAVPVEIAAGRLKVGEDRTFQVRLRNDGGRLLYGSAAADGCPWLAVGDGAGAPRKLFQFADEATLAVHVRGKGLRAGHKPQEGRLVLESNGGTLTVVVRVEVPVKPFPTGALAGAQSPRQVAEKAKAAPKDAAALFEQGAVAQWYRDNGWVYPVQGPSATGTGAVQQFFEALGLTAPPKVDISERYLTLQGNPGEQLQRAIEVRTPESRIVWAHGTSDQPWLEVGRSRPAGRTVSIPLNVREVPYRPGEVLRANVTVTSNGNQRFVVPVTLTVGNTPVPVRARPSSADMAIATTPLAPGAPRPVPAVPAIPTEGKNRRWIHLIPLGVIGLCMLVVLVRDLFVSGTGPGAFLGLQDNEPRIGLRLHDGKKGDAIDDDMPDPTMRFGLVMLKQKEPTKDTQKEGKLKRLTFDEWGRSNNTCVRIDGSDRLFGDPKPVAGRWVARESKWKDDAGREHEGSKAVWIWDDKKVAVTQTVEVVRGEQSGLLDTCLVRYLAENQDTSSHAVGIRFLLDTFIGANDGVPFTIPGSPGLADSQQEFNTAEQVPDFIQALENENLQKPGTVAHLKLKLGGRSEPPSRVTLGAWPDPDLKLLPSRPTVAGQHTLWDVPVVPMKTLFPYDSAVTIYWAEKPLKQGEKREMGFAYGLGSVHSSGKLLLTVDGSFKPGGDLTVTVLVSDPKPDEKLTLTLPPGFEVKGGSAEQAVPPLPAGAASRNSPVTWKVKAGPVGEHTLRVQSSTGDSQSGKVIIRASSIFD